MAEMVAVLQAYINHMTGKTVQIAKPKSIRERIMLQDAYNIALKNLDNITLL